MNPMVRDKHGEVVALRPSKESIGELERKVGDEGDVFSFLATKGYHVSPKDRIGEGHTSTVYLARYKSGSVDQNRAVKIPKDDIDSSSVCTVINTSKGDLNAREIGAANLTSFRHDNIVSVLDSYRHHGKTIIVEEFVPGQSAQDLAAINPFNERAISNIYRPVCKAVGYLHEEGILHRDIKPSNILVESDKWKGVTRVKLGDLQNAARIRDIDQVVLPTRGGTSCTYPDLLNAIIEGREDSASKRTDIYALGASIFESATGEPSFDYRIEFDENGKEVIIGGKPYKVSLMEGNRKIARIDSNEHNEKLKLRVKKLPPKLRRPVYRALSMDFRDQYYDVGGLEKDLEYTEESFLKRAGEKILGSIKPALITGVIALVGAGMTYLLTRPEPESKPTMHDILKTTQADRYPGFDLALDLKGKEGDFASQEEAKYKQDILAPYIKKVKEKLPALMDSVARRGPFGGVYTVENEVQMLTKRLAQIQGVDLKLASAWAKGIYLLNEKKVLDIYGKDELGKTNRLPPSYVPRRFVEINSPFGIPVEDRIDNSPGYGIIWLKQSLIGERNVPGTFAEYFCDKDEKGTAIVRSGSIDYFPRMKPEGVSDTLPPEIQRKIAKVYTVEPGYAQAIDPRKQEIINTLLAVYALTDSTGKLDTSLVHVPEFPRGTYTQRLSLPPK